MSEQTQLAGELLRRFARVSRTADDLIKKRSRVIGFPVDAHESEYRGNLISRFKLTEIACSDKERGFHTKSAFTRAKPATIGD